MEEVDAAASFFPTADEVVRAVQFVRENPAVVLGVVVGLTSLSVARYFEENDELEGEEQPVLSAPEQDEQAQIKLSEAASSIDPLPARLTRSSTSSLLNACGDSSSLAGTTSTDTIESGELTAEGHTHDHTVNELGDKLHKSCSFCNQDKENTDTCCDPDWGWFIPTSPEDAHHERERRKAGARGA